MARWVKSKQSMRIFKTSTTPTTTDGLTVGDIWIDTTSGAVEKVCTSVSPVTFVTSGADSNSNISGNNVIVGYAITATAAGTTTLTVASAGQQFFTGSTTQTVLLPVTSTLSLGHQFRIVNNSSGVVTVQSSGANTIVAMAAATELVVTCILTSGTGTASWDYKYTTNASGITGSGSMVRATSPTLVTPVLGAASATSIAFTSTSGVIGTTTNDNAAAGSVGEVISSQVLYADRIAMTTQTATNVTSISLTAGDWDVTGNIFVNTGALITKETIAWISTTSATMPDFSLITDLNLGSGFATGLQGLIAPSRRLSLSATTTVYLGAYCNTTGGNSTVCGLITARRAR